MLSGQYSLYDKVLNTGDGFFINPASKRYDLYSLTDNDSFVDMQISGYNVQKFLTSCSIPLHTHIFSHPNGLEIAELIKFEASHEYHNQDIDLVLTSLLYKVMSYYKKPSLETNRPFRPGLTTVNSDTPYLQVVLKHIEEHYTENISVAEIARMVHLTPNYLSGIFKKLYGVSLQRYIIKYRISIATELLSDTSLSIGTIAGMVGYPDAQHFSQIFKSLLHYTPSKYREITKMQNI